jgi:hypothetical protein
LIDLKDSFKQQLAKQTSKLNSNFNFIQQQQQQIIREEEKEEPNTFKLPIDEQLLFSFNRVLYSLMKSMPHFLCLSYVTMKLSSMFFKQLCKSYSMKNFIIKKMKKAFKIDHKHRNTKNLLAIQLNNTKYNLYYEKKQQFQQHQQQIKSTSNDQFNEKERIRKMIDNYLAFNRQLFKTELNSFENVYVKNILNNHSNYSEFKETKTFRSSFLDLIFDCNFQFSTRLICTYTVCFTLLYYLTCFLLFYGTVLIDLIYLPSAYKWVIYLSTCFTSFICAIQLIQSLIQFKRHLCILYKGETRDESTIININLNNNYKTLHQQQKNQIKQNKVSHFAFLSLF